MVNNPIEKYFNEKITNAISFIINYVKVEFAILFNPTCTFPNLLSNKSTSLKGPAFLGANILLAYSIGLLAGYRIARFPLDIPLLKNWMGDASFIIVRFILGTTIFLSFLVYLAKKNKFVVTETKIFTVICYASAIFIPFVLAKRVMNSIFVKSWIDIMYPLINKTFKFNPLDFLSIAFCLIGTLFFIIWWLKLIYLGLRVLIGKRRLKTIILLSCFLYLTIKLIVSSTFFIMKIYPFFSAVKIMVYDDIGKALSKQPPDYYKASLLAQEVFHTEAMPLYYRYAAKIREITYSIAMPLIGGNDNEEVVKKSLQYIKDYDYAKVEVILETYLKKMVKDKTSLKKPLYENWMRGLEKARELRNAPGYVEKPWEDDSMKYGVFVFLEPGPIALIP